jgi:hypothetical protein
MIELIQTNIKYLVVLDLLMLFSFFVIFRKQIPVVINRIRNWKMNFQGMKRTWDMQVVYLVLALMGFLIFLSAVFPLSTDECSTFWRFSAKGFYYSYCTYPIPNNHIVVSLMSNMVYPLVQFFESPNLIRIVPLLISLIFFSYTSAYFKRKYDDWRLLIYWAAFLVLPSLLVYDYQLRGYVIMSYSGAALAILIWNHLDSKCFFPLFSIVQIIGLCTHPGWLYTFSGTTLIVCVLNLRDKVFLRNVFLCTYVISGVTLMFYSPLFIFEGIASVAKNQYVAPLESISVMDTLLWVDHIFEFYLSQVKFLSDFELLKYVFYASCLYIIVFRKKVAILSMPLIMVVMMMVLKQMPFERVFIGVFVFVLTTVLVSLPAMPKMRIGVVIPFSILVISFAYWNYQYNYFSFDQSLAQVQKYLRKDIDDFKINTLYFGPMDCLPENLSIEYKWRNTKLQLVQCASIDDAVLLASNDGGNSVLIYSSYRSGFSAALSEKLGYNVEVINRDYSLVRLP